MNGAPPESTGDLWSEWLLHGRHADDPQVDRRVREGIERYADRVLDGAQLAAGMTLADIGTGDGLVALRAIERVGPTLQVILTDISAPLLRHAEARAIARQIHGQCTFVPGSAERLGAIADGGVDAVTTRAVLAYVADKPAALREFHRILRPGGRLSIAEPIFRDEAFAASALRQLLEGRSAQAEERFLPLLHRWKAAQFPDTDEQIARSPIANFSERDLLRFVQASGFTDLHLELHIDVQPSPVSTWDAFLGSSPHPWAPPLRSILAERFSAVEREFFERIVRPSVEAGASFTTDRIVYVTARKPAGPEPMPGGAAVMP